VGAEIHHLGSQKCNLEKLEEICPMLSVRPIDWRFPLCSD